MILSGRKLIRKAELWSTIILNVFWRKLIVTLWALELVKAVTQAHSLRSMPFSLLLRQVLHFLEKQCSRNEYFSEVEGLLYGPGMQIKLG